MGSGIQMDWIDAILEKLADRFQKTSLRRSLWYYMTATILGVLLAYALTFTILAEWENLILDQNMYEVTHPKFVTEIGKIVMISSSEATPKAQNMINILHVAEIFLMIMYPVIGVCIASHFYYQNKLKEPLEKMIEEAAYIGRDDLSMPCKWDTQDEIGKACEAIEKMRKRLIENKQDMWELMEQQRDLNAAFAHDLRTPLTVMQGYTEMLIQFYPKGKMSQEKLMETFSCLDRQVKRLKNFAQTMKDIHSIEMMDIKKERTLLEKIEQKIRQTGEGLEQARKIQIEVKKSADPKQGGYFDENIILEVAENLLSNALRYAKSKIEILLEIQGDFLLLYVKDDGRGFCQEEFYQAMRPYYTDPQKKEEGTHYGLGLSICKILCKKHGGTLELSNSIEGGAIVCASFYIV